MYFVPHGQNLHPNTQEDGTNLNEIQCPPVNRAILQRRFSIFSMSGEGE